MILSAKQQAAATRTGQDVCIVAGPGSGKTRVLIERFAWLVREQKIPAGRILAITFTEKAATEIKHRLVDEFSGAPETRAAIERAWVSTVHSFCARLLRENAIAAGIDPAFGILQADDSANELGTIATGVLDSLLAEQPEALRRLLNAVHVSSQSGSFAADLPQALLGVYEAMRIAGQDPAELPPPPPAEPDSQEPVRIIQALLDSRLPASSNAQRQRIEDLASWVDSARALAGKPLSPDHFRLWDTNLCSMTGLRAGDAVYEAVNICRAKLKRLRIESAGLYYQRERDVVVEALRRLDVLYRQHKRQRSLLDFGDLEEHAIGLLESNTQLRQSIAGAFDQILMDELQDTNPLQWRLVDLLRRPGNFFAVGDINQSIYGFRHADPGMFARYQQQLEAKGHSIDRLNDNYRSREAILTTVEELLSDQPGIEPNPLQALGRFPDSGIAPVELHCAEAEDLETATGIEASWVARRIRELEGIPLADSSGGVRPARFSDMAILARTTAGLESMRGALAEFGIPHLLVGGHEFFEKAEICDLVHWLELLSNPSNEIALAGVLRSPIASVSDETLLRIREHDVSLIDSVERALDGNPFGCDPDELERLAWFWNLLSSQRRLADFVPPDRLLAAMLDESGYEQALTAAARYNTVKFLALLRGRFASAPQPLAELLADLHRIRLAGAEPDAPPGDASNVVTLLSMHGAKGLEFPIVFLVALHKGTSRQQPPISYSPAAGLGINWRDPSKPATAIADCSRDAHAGEVQDREEGEEQRLLYVAMTRAEEHLVLSYSTRLERAQISSLAKLVSTRLKPIEIRHQQKAVNDLPPLAAAAGEELLLARRAPAGDESDSAITVTDLAVFRQCPRQYYLSRYLGIEAPPAAGEGGTGEMPAADLGTQVHALLAHQRVANPSGLALKLAEAFESSELGRRAARASRLEREFEVLMAVGDVVVRGTIDLWFEEGGELVLVDYKTDRLKPEEAPDPHYAIQIRLYALALQAITGKLPALAALFYARWKMTIPVSLSAAELEDAKAAVGELRQAQSRLDFPMRPGSRCQYCPHYHHSCPAP